MIPELVFEQLLSQKDKIQATFDEKCAALEAEYQTAMEDAGLNWHRYSCESKGEDNVTPQFIERAKNLRAWFDLHATAIEKALDHMAIKCGVIPSETALLFRRVSSADYNSQGFGASGYAKGDAQNSLDHATFNNYKAEMRVNRHESDRWGVNHADFEVWVFTTEIGLEILRRKPTISLRDWLKTCWKRGVNPRVINPFLPSGLEEKLGIDFFGNDVKT